MWGQMQDKTKMEIAANVLTTSVNNLSDTQKIGLVAYGHRKKGDCKDVEFLVDVENGTKSDVNKSIKGIKPLGKTPLAYSALLVIDKLRQSKLKATIILVTDGIESCGGNICEVIKVAKNEGIEFRLHIIGFGLNDGDTQQLKCAAEVGGGNYYIAADAGGLRDVLEEATATTVDELDGNVSVYTVKNGLAIDAIVKAYDIVSKRKPISVRTYQDTAYFYLPPSKYNFEVSPLEGSDVKMITVTNIESFEDKIVHKTISFDGGKLGITTTNNSKHWDCGVNIINQNGKVVAFTRTYNSPKEVEINPGTYKVTIQALATMEGLDTYTEFENVKIESDIITPISFDFKTGDFKIYTKVGNENIDCVVTINEVKSGKNVAGSRTYSRGAKFLLNPGTYQVKVQPLGAHKGKSPQTFTMEVKQGKLITKEIKF
jgi:Ca-activated chloride channel family protein